MGGGLNGKGKPATIPPNINMDISADELHHLRAESLKWAPANIVEGADELIKLKNSKGPWEVIDYIIKLWKSTKPKEFRSHLITLEETKQSRKVTKGWSGVSKDKKSGGVLRYLVDIPEKVVYMIRIIYTPEQLPMDKPFYKKWAKRYPDMKISKKV